MSKIPLINEVSRYNFKKYPLYKCKKCSFAMPFPSPFKDHSGTDFYDEEEHIRFFDKKKNSIDFESEEYKYYYKHFMPYIELISKYKIRGKSLDIGCGPGHLMALEKKEGINAEGMEVSPMLSKILENKGFKMHIGLLGEVKLGKYDLITMNQVLEHIPNPEKAIREINKSLKNNAYLILAVPYIYGIVPQILRSKWYGLGYGQHINFFSKKSIVMLLERNGFKIEEIKILSVDYTHPNFPAPLNIIANLIMRLNVLLGLGDNMFVVARKNGEIK